MSAHVVQWVTASPLWADTLSEPNDAKREQAMQKPALLRFERDSFMEDVAKLLDRDPAELTTTVAKPVTYRLPSPGETEPPAPADLKLYLPSQGHFYLLAATLVCRLPGLPEHEVATAAKETVNFVLRRVDDEHPGAEFAWVDDANAAKGKSWQHLDPSSAGALADGEDLLPLFPVRYTSDDRLRRLFVGLVPTSSGEAFKAAGQLSPIVSAGSPDAGAPSADPRPDALTAKVTDPLRLLIAAETSAPDGTPAGDVAAIEQAMADQQVEASRFLLLDFAEFLHDELGWFASSTWTQPTDAKGLALWATLGAPAVQSGGTSWRSALATAWSERLKLMGDAEGDSSLQLNLHDPGLQPDTLDAAVKDALPPAQKPPPGVAVSVQGDVASDPPAVPKLDSRGASQYMLRCVYRRPECGALCPDVVSAPSDKFRIASFFDLDAPARSITITMPIDTNIKDLRKLRKNVSFLISNELRNQMNRVTNMKDALDGKFADGQSLDVGMICSFSIPMITICALIVLMIFISLLNIVFWWMPFLRICFPIALKAK
ncbi:MAG TPA: hypothetical protein VH108_01475 [Gaiellaceae bacterium]|nr:hypothetical protein [Gaiellaceae bacterium]